MKCKMCNGKSSYDYCKRCGLYLGETKPHLKKYIETIDGFIERLETRKQFNYYSIFKDGHVYIKYKGFNKLVRFLDDNFDVGMLQHEIEVFIKIISYLCFTINHNVTLMALKLFGMLSVHIPQYDKYCKYWYRQGIKINDWGSYLYAIATIDASKHPDSIINKHKRARIERKMRRIGKLSF